jgi:hypothetical protein
MTWPGLKLKLKHALRWVSREGKKERERVSTGGTASCGDSCVLAGWDSVDHAAHFQCAGAPRNSAPARASNHACPRARSRFEFWCHNQGRWTSSALLRISNVRRGTRCAIKPNRRVHACPTAVAAACGDTFHDAWPSLLEHKGGRAASQGLEGTEKPR